MPSLDQLHRLLAADPHDPFLLYGVAQEHAKAGNHAESLSWYDRCLAADPAYAYAYFHKARSLEAMGQISAAISTLEAGQQAARAAGDAHAQAEISGYLDELSP